MTAADLRGIPLFAGLSRAERALLTSLLQRTEHAAGAILIHEGEPSDRFSIIATGKVEVIKALGLPEERLLAVLGPGEYLGEMGLLVEDGRRSASVRASDAVTLLELARPAFTQLIDRHPQLAVSLLRMLTRRLRDAETTMIQDLQAKNAQLTEAYHQLQAAQAERIAQEKLAQELRTARQIQSSLIPTSFPALPGWQLSAYWEPARSVGGDFYDVVALPDGRYGITIGDVTDKGIPAALMMAVARSVLRAPAVVARSPEELLAQANDLLCLDMPPHMFVTCLYVMLDPLTGHVRLANAGHPLPQHLTRDAVTELRATGMPLGLLPGMRYEECDAVIAPGEGLMLFSDGLIEAHDQQGLMYGLPRLLALLEGLRRPTTAVDVTVAGLRAFTGPDWEQEDDLTVVLVQREHGLDA